MHSKAVERHKTLIWSARSGCPNVPSQPCVKNKQTSPSTNISYHCNMAELAAIGLASNILHFVELGVKLFSLAREAYRTGTIPKDGALRNEIQSVRAMAETIQVLCQKSDKSEIASQLRKLVKEGDAIADVVLQFLHDISTRIEKGKKFYERIWGSLEQAVATLSHEDQTLAIEKRMRDFKSDLQFYAVAASV